MNQIYIAGYINLPGGLLEPQSEVNVITSLDLFSTRYHIDCSNHVGPKIEQLYKRITP
jgi:hypothetical protein